ncbi:MAG TPA: type VI secretion system contractile sheath large subunit, partial [Gemmataceae bacterium]|nr:type VI secretion system contractile sheath large subunit [Gemmataceae bacterium]
MAETQQAAAAAASTTEADGQGLLDQILDQTKPADTSERQRNQQFIQEVVRQALAAKPGSVVAGDIERTIKVWQAEIDKKLSAQLNQIMHHPEFQKLEGTWRGLDYLVKQSETGERLRIKVLNVSKKELAKDLEKAVEFDQSRLFKIVYEAEYGQLGGYPFGMLIGDYEFGKHPQDVEFLRKMAGVCSSAHAPFIAAAAPNMFGLDSYTELNQPRDLAKIFQSVDYAAWKSFRESEDSRYIALVLPRVLARLPYGAATKPIEEFNYEEGVDGTDHEKYSWMSAAWAYGARVTDAFAKDGWFMRTRGVEG